MSQARIDELPAGTLANWLATTVIEGTDTTVTTGFPNNSGPTGTNFKFDRTVLDAYNASLYVNLSGDTMTGGLTVPSVLVGSGAANVTLSSPAAGQIQFQSVGGVSNENLIFDFDALNKVNVSSTSGVTEIDFGSIDILGGLFNGTNLANVIDLTVDDQFTGVAEETSPGATTKFLAELPITGAKRYVALSNIQTNPSGADTQIQFNSSGSFGASADFRYSNGLQIDSAGIAQTPLLITGASGQITPLMAVTSFGGSAGDLLALTAAGNFTVGGTVQGINLTTAGPGTNFLADDGTYKPGGSASPLTTKGDLYTYDTADARLPVGTDGLPLVADSGETTGLAYKSQIDGFRRLNFFGDITETEIFFGGFSYIFEDSSATCVARNAEYTGSQTVARSTTASIVRAAGNLISFDVDTGLTVGNPYSPTTRASVSTTGFLINVPTSCDEYRIGLTGFTSLTKPSSEVLRMGATETLDWDFGGGTPDTVTVTTASGVQEIVIAGGMDFQVGGRKFGTLVEGPASVAADGNIAVYDQLTGKLIKDGGTTVAALEPNLGTPTANGEILTSTTGDVRSWEANLRFASNTLNVTNKVEITDGSGDRISFDTSVANPRVDVEHSSGPLFKLQALSGEALLGTETNHAFGFRTNNIERARLNIAGDWLHGTLNGPTGGGKTIMMGDNGGDPTPGANTAGIYVKDVAGTKKVFAVDSAGATTQLTP